VRNDTDTDAALATRAAAGDERAFTALMRRHKETVYRVARQHIGDADEAYDVVQDVFVSAWRHLDQYDPTRLLSTWLYRITVNKCRDRHRRKVVRAFFFRAAPMDGPTAVQVVDETERVEDRAVDRDELRRVAAEIARLPVGTREAFVLNVVEGLPQKEVAEVLGVSVKSVETRVARARRKLVERRDDDT